MLDGQTPEDPSGDAGVGGSQAAAGVKKPGAAAGKEVRVVYTAAVKSQAALVPPLEQ